VRAPHVVALAVFVVLAVVHTWPLATDPAHLSRNDNGDALLNTWAIAWVAHQLPRNPLHLFDANIFYPERLTLGYSEAMIVQGLLAWPVLALGGSPVLAFNLVLLAGFALTGWAFALLIRAWTGSWSAAYVGGSLAAFNSHVLVRLPHLQAQHVEFIALMLFALDRLVSSRKFRDAVLLGSAFALQGLTSVYLLVFSVWTLAFATLARAREWALRNPAVMIARLALAGVLGAAVMSPYLYAYYSVHQLTGWERSVDEQFAGSWVDYLATGSRLHWSLWSYRYFDAANSKTFPGIVALILTGLALSWPETRRDARVRMCAVTAVGCAAVSVLPHAPFYQVLHRLIPLFRAVRVPAHLGQIVLLMVAVVAAFGVAGLERRFRMRQKWPIVAAVLCAAVNLEALRAPLVYRPFQGISSVYGVLEASRRAVVVELPFYPARQVFGNAPYMLNSTRHWQPMLNGYSGFLPDSYDAAYQATQGFPDERSLLALHELGVTHVVVHERAFGDHARFEAIARVRSLREIGEDGDIHIYQLR
jgi:hypothetical protein